MRLCVRPVISSRCKCFLVHVAPLIYSSEGIFINPPLIARPRRTRRRAIPPIIGVSPPRSKRGEHGGNVFTPESWPSAGPTSLSSSLMEQNARRAGEVSASDAGRSCVSSACLADFVLAGLFPVCTSRVCGSGA